jgi:gamma-glutamyltranspeptidase
VPGAFDGRMTLLEKPGTMKLAGLLAPAIDDAENGFAVMEKTAGAPHSRKDGLALSW